MHLIVLAGVALCAGLLWLGSRIPPRQVSRDEMFRLGAELPLFPFGRQPTEPIDADRIRAGRPF
jgi:hypothetical protein